eukprot:4337159-Lingulodinium_polyedra.AAC.1
MYSMEKQPIDDLKVDEEHPTFSEPVRDQLLSALALLKLKRPCRVMLAQFLAGSDLKLAQKDRQ